MVALAVSDNGDGSGGVITVSGNNPVDASIYTSYFAGSIAQRSWNLLGVVNGDGPIALPTTDMGGYTALAIAADGNLATPVNFRLTDGTDPLHWQIMQSVREYVMGLSLPSVSADPDNHAVVKLPYRPDEELNLETELRETCVFYFPVAETYRAHTNEDDTVVYGVNVLFIRKLEKRLFEGLKEMLSDRQLFGQSMSACPIPDVEEVHTVEITPGSVYLPEHWKNSFDCSNMVFRCFSEQPNGVY